MAAADAEEVSGTDDGGSSADLRCIERVDEARRRRRRLVAADDAEEAAGMDDGGSAADLRHSSRADEARRRGR